MGSDCISSSPLLIFLLYILHWRSFLPDGNKADRRHNHVPIIRIVQQINEEMI